MLSKALGVLISTVIWLFFASSMAWGSISISPSSIASTYTGKVTLTASVTSGASASIDIVFDSDQDGAIDSSEIGWRHYDVKDGQVLPPTGAELVADTDGLANGTIVVPILNMATDEPIVGHFVVRVKSGSSTNTATFVINAPSASQSIAGQVKLNGTGKAGAAMLLNSVGDMNYICLTDASGNYTIPILSVGTYYVTGVVLNEASSTEGLAASVSISAGQHKTGVNINIPSNAYRLKGQILRADNSQPVPYTWVKIRCDDSGMDLNLVSDGGGNYDAGVSNGLWTSELEKGSKIGFMGGHFSNQQTTVTVSGATISGKNYFLTPIAAYVTGKARNAKTLAALPGAILIASPPGSYDWTGITYSDSNGNFALGLAAGQWDLRGQIEEESPLSQTYLYPRANHSRTIVPGAAAQDLGNIDFMPADGSVTVKIVDQNKNPLSGIRVAGGGVETNNDWQGAMLTTDASGNVKVLTRSGVPWYVFFAQEGLPYPAPDSISMDFVAARGNVITIYPPNYRRRPYAVYGGNTLPTDFNNPQDSGFTLLGGGTGTATFSGTYFYYAVVAYSGEVLIDSIRGSDGLFITPAISCNVLNLGEITGKPDNQYATVGNSGSKPDPGVIIICVGHYLEGISVIHPDDKFNAIAGWGIYGDGK